MGVGELGDVLRQGLRIAGDVEDALEATGQFAGVGSMPARGGSTKTLPKS